MCMASNFLHKKQLIVNDGEMLRQVPLTEIDDDQIVEARQFLERMRLLPQETQLPPQEVQLLPQEIQAAIEEHDDHALARYLENQQCETKWQHYQVAKTYLCIILFCLFYNSL